MEGGDADLATLERVRKGIEDWPDGQARETALRAVDALIADLTDGEREHDETRPAPT